MDLSENAIKRQILDYLEKIGVMAWLDKQITNPRRIGPSGVADIVGLLKNGRFLGIEVKRPKGVLSTAQVTWIRRVKENGGIAFVATSVEDVRNKLKFE